MVPAVLCVSLPSHPEAMRDGKNPIGMRYKLYDERSRSSESFPSSMDGSDKQQSRCKRLPQEIAVSKRTGRRDSALHKGSARVPVPHVQDYAS